MILFDKFRSRLSIFGKNSHSFSSSYFTYTALISNILQPYCWYIHKHLSTLIFEYNQHSFHFYLVSIGSMFLLSWWWFWLYIFIFPETNLKMFNLFNLMFLLLVIIMLLFFVFTMHLLLFKNLCKDCFTDISVLLYALWKIIQNILIRVFWFVVDHVITFTPL